MNPPRLALAILMIVPAVLFIAAAESAADTPASAPAAQAEKTAAPAATTASQAAAAPATPPLRTMEPELALPGTGMADQQATTSILSAIRADPGLAGADVSVHTDNGVVTLTGVVRSREQSALASAYANRPLGVMRVDNELSIPAQ
jgi:osmotically-inducible protein OsmY